MVVDFGVGIGVGFGWVCGLIRRWLLITALALALALAGFVVLLGDGC